MLKVGLYINQGGSVVIRRAAGSDGHSLACCSVADGIKGGFSVNIFYRNIYHIVTKLGRNGFIESMKVIEGGEIFTQSIAPKLTRGGEFVWNIIRTHFFIESQYFGLFNNGLRQCDGRFFVFMIHRHRFISEDQAIRLEQQE